jgi:hypothetical protein
MSNTNNSELENLDSWDVEHAEVRPPVKPSRVVVSVSFRREDFDQVSKLAELNGRKTSQFIRDAAIEKTLPQRQFLWFSSFSGSLGASWFSDQLPTITIVSGHEPQHIQEQEEPITT